VCVVWADGQRFLRFDRCGEGAQMSTAAEPSTNPFESQAVGKPRLVWAPDVHEHYSEICSFFLVRLVNPQLSHRLDLAELLAKASIKSFCVYPVYGHFDFLVRMWVTPQKRTRFLRLVNNQTLFDEVDEFQARKIDYLWTAEASSRNGDGRDGNQRVNRFLSDIERLCEDLDAGRHQDATAIKRLLDNGLIYRLPVITAANQPAGYDTRLYKFYFALSRIPSPTRNAKEVEVASIRDYLVQLQRETGLQQVTLNEGIGFADYLIKGVVPDYYAIFECNRRLTELIDRWKFNLRPETFLIGTPNPHESDYIDVTWREFGGEELRLEQALPPGFAADLAKLQKEELRAIADVFVHYETRFIDTPFEPFFKDLLCARISRDRDLLSNAMSVMHRIEGYAIDFFRQQWMEEFGSKWFAELKQAATKVGLEAFDPKKYTLKEAMDVSNSLPSICARVRKELVDDWLGKIGALLQYRNDLAHGVIFTDPDYVVKHWEQLSRSILDAGSLYNRLFEIFHRNKQKER
jgi:hypothetical protein